MRTHATVSLFAVLLLQACSSPPPKPPAADGEIVAANDQKSLEELVRAAVAAANPKAQRYSAVRGENLKDVLIRWTQQEHIRLFYQTTFNAVHPASARRQGRASGLQQTRLPHRQRN